MERRKEGEKWRERGRGETEERGGRGKRGKEGKGKRGEGNGGETERGGERERKRGGEGVRKRREGDRASCAIPILQQLSKQPSMGRADDTHNTRTALSS